MSQCCCPSLNFEVPVDAVLMSDGVLARCTALGEVALWELHTLASCFLLISLFLRLIVLCCMFRSSRLYCFGILFCSKVRRNGCLAPLQSAAPQSPADVARAFMSTRPGGEASEPLPAVTMLPGGGARASTSPVVTATSPIVTSPGGTEPWVPDPQLTPLALPPEPQGYALGSANPGWGPQGTPSAFREHAPDQPWRQAQGHTMGRGGRPRVYHGGGGEPGVYHGGGGTRGIPWGRGQNQGYTMGEGGQNQGYTMGEGAEPGVYHGGGGAEPGICHFGVSRPSGGSRASFMSLDGEGYLGAHRGCTKGVQWGYTGCKPGISYFGGFQAQGSRASFMSLDGEGHPGGYTGGAPGVPRWLCGAAERERGGLRSCLWTRRGLVGWGEGGGRGRVDLEGRRRVGCGAWANA